MKFASNLKKSYEKLPLSWRQSEDEVRKQWSEQGLTKSRFTGQHSGLILSAAISGILSFALGVLLTSFWMPRSSDVICARYTSRASPFIEDVGLKWTIQEIDGTVFHTNKYRNSPSDAVDEAWETLGSKVQQIVVPDNIAAAAGFSEERGFVQVKPEYGGGFLGTIDGLHNIHCLNVLRQVIWWNYPYYYAKDSPIFKTRLGVKDDLVAKYHVYHCLDFLRQDTMCNVDVGLSPLVWSNYSVWRDERGEWTQEPSPRSYFNNPKPCKNFDDVLEWAENHQWNPSLPMWEYRKMVVPPDESTPIYGLP